MKVANQFEVYCAVNRVNGKRYVGVSSHGAVQRWKAHVWDSRKGKPGALRAAIRCYGEDAFTVSVLEHCVSAEVMFARERFWIEHLNTLAPNGYNLTTGGFGVVGFRPSPEVVKRRTDSLRGQKRSDEMRAKMRAIALARPPEHMEKVKAKLVGKHHTDEARAKVATARAKQVFSQETIEKRTAKLRGRKHTEQSRVNMAKAQKGRMVSSDHRGKIADTLAALSREQAAIVRFNALRLPRQCDYAALYGVSVQTIGGIVKGRTYRHVTEADLPMELRCSRSRSG